MSESSASFLATHQDKFLATKLNLIAELKLGKYFESPRHAPKHFSISQFEMQYLHIDQIVYIYIFFQRWLIFSFYYLPAWQ
jgi:hypothetical protein